MNADEIEIDEELTFRIPIETWEFFTAYALIAQIEKKGIDGSKNPSDFLVHVIADAFNKAGQEDTFFSRTAYENAGIQNILLSEFWKQEVEPRIQVVRDHLKELDSALILQTMVSLAKPAPPEARIHRPSQHTPLSHRRFPFQFNETDVSHC